MTCEILFWKFLIIFQNANVSTIFCLVRKQILRKIHGKLLNFCTILEESKNMAIHQDFDSTTHSKSYNFVSSFNLRIVDHFWKKQISQYIKIKSRNGFCSRIHEKLHNSLLSNVSHFLVHQTSRYIYIHIRKFASSFVCRGATSYNFVHLSTLSRVERIRIGSREMCIVVRNTIQIMLGTFITRSFFSEWRRRINRSSFAQYIPDLLFRCHARDVAPSDKGN